MKKILTIMALLVAFVTTGFAEDQEEVTWTVAGSAAALNGNADWAEANANNDMTSTDGVNFTLTVTDCTLEQGTNYEFKVVKDHAWDEAYPSQNYSFTVSETATYTVVYSFNTDTKAVGVETTKTGEAGQITHTYTVAGEPAALFGEEWNPEKTDNDMTLSGGLYTWTKNDVVLGDNLSIAFKICVDHAWGTSYPSSNYVVDLGNGYDGAGTYDVTITFNESTKKVNATFVKQVEDAEISSVVFSYGIAGQEPWTNLALTKDGNTNTYTGTLDLSNVIIDQAFKLNVNDGTWIGTQQLTLVDDDNLVTVSATAGENFILKNATSGYKTYTLTATWTPSADASAGWTLTIVPGDERPKTTYTATFVNGAGWENVYAYIWKVDGDNNVKLNGDYPGQKLVKSGTETINTVVYDVYTFTFETYDATAVPQFIIFSDGTTTNKTDDLEFVNEKKYTETVPGNAEITSVKVVVPGAPIDPFDITNKKEEVDGKYVYSMDMDLSVVTDNIPFYFVVNGTQIPLDNITVEGLLVESPNTPLIGDCIILMQNNHAVYTATATWTPNPDATANWTMKVVGKEARPSETTYSILYNTTNQANEWKVGDTMTGTEGVFTTTFNNKPGMRFAIAPTGSIGISGINWTQIIRPKVTSGDFEINYFSNYSDETEVVESGGKVWWIMDDNASGLTLTFNPADNKFTIVSDATTTASISTAGYATYSMSKPFTVEGAEVYIVTGVASGEANMVKLEGANLEIPAGTGVILKGEAGDYTVKPSFGEGSVAGNLLIGTGESPNGYDITGVYPQEMGGGEYTAYIFANKEPNGVGFYLLDSSNGSTIAPFKAFLAVPKSQTAPDFIGFGDTTGIDATLNDNGQMINDNIIYDLSGRRVMNPTKGLYIINGKKVVIK